MLKAEMEAKIKELEEVNCGLNRAVDDYILKNNQLQEKMKRHEHFHFVTDQFHSVCEGARQTAQQVQGEGLPHDWRERGFQPGDEIQAVEIEKRDIKESFWNLIGFIEGHASAAFHNEKRSEYTKKKRYGL